MDNKRLLITALIALKNGNIATLTGEVKSVNESAYTCTVEVDGLSIPDVQLKANEDESGWFLIPEEKSIVIMDMISPGRYYISLFGKLKKVVVKIESSTFELSKDGVFLNGNKNGGVMIAADVIKKFNSLENSINELKTVFKIWTPPVGTPDSGAALKTAVSTWAGENISVTGADELQSNKVKHG